MRISLIDEYRTILIKLAPSLRDGCVFSIPIQNGMYELATGHNIVVDCRQTTTPRMQTQKLNFIGLSKRTISVPCEKARPAIALFNLELLVLRYSVQGSTKFMRHVVGS